MPELYDLVSPLDFRYYAGDEAFFERLKPYVSEAGFIRYQARVEKTLLKAFFDLGWLPQDSASALMQACDDVSAAEVYEEEKRTGHAVRALVNCIGRRASSEDTRFVHLFATSNDITDTANALRYQDLVRDVLLPDLLRLQTRLIGMAREFADTVQIGRTHGRHAVPITFGFAIALYVDRLGSRIMQLDAARQNVRGQLSGAVGAYNALSLQLPHAAVLFEKLVLSYLGLQPAPGSISTQIVQPDFAADLGYAAHSCFGVLANLADDIRHLHRSEIDEVQARYSADTVGSSTMPHKVNPKDYENIKSMWKALAPSMLTLLMDQISEHQRDLTNSASQRFTPELFTALDYCVVRMERALGTLHVRADKMRRNLEDGRDNIMAEPLYVILALRGVPRAYDRVRELATRARESQVSLMDLAMQDAEISASVRTLTEEQRGLLHDPSKYVGQARQRALAVAAHWEGRSRELGRYLEAEREVLRSVGREHVEHLVRRIAEVERGAQLPEDFCPAEDRRTMIERWIAEPR